MDKQSGESVEEEVIGEGIGESEMEELVPEWCWRRDNGNWFQRQGEAFGDVWFVLGSETLLCLDYIICAGFHALHWFSLKFML